MPVKPIPEGHHSVTPYLLVESVADLITFLQNAFGAAESGRHQRPDGSVMHAEVRVGDSMVMMGEPMGEFGPAPCHVFLYVEDCDAVYEQALAAGGTSVMEVTHMHHAGVKYGGVKDPSGNTWWVGTHVEDVSWDEQARRIQALADSQSE